MPEKQPEKLGVAKTLPERARERLAKAAQKARSFPVGSISRKRTIDEAIAYVRTRWPECFRRE